MTVKWSTEDIECMLQAVRSCGFFTNTWSSPHKWDMVLQHMQLHGFSKPRTSLMIRKKFQHLHWSYKHLRSRSSTHTAVCRHKCPPSSQQDNTHQPLPRRHLRPDLYAKMDAFFMSAGMHYNARLGSMPQGPNPNPDSRRMCADDDGVDDISAGIHHDACMGSVSEDHDPNSDSRGMHAAYDDDISAGVHRDACMGSVSEDHDRCIHAVGCPRCCLGLRGTTPPLTSQYHEVERPRVELEPKKHSVHVDVQDMNAHIRYGMRGCLVTDVMELADILGIEKVRNDKNDSDEADFKQGKGEDQTVDVAKWTQRQNADVKGNERDMDCVVGCEDDTEFGRGKPCTSRKCNEDPSTKRQPIERKKLEEMEGIGDVHGNCIKKMSLQKKRRTFQERQPCPPCSGKMGKGALMIEDENHVILQYITSTERQLLDVIRAVNKSRETISSLLQK